MTKYKWDIPTNKDKIIGWQGKRIIALEDELATLKVAVAWLLEAQGVVDDNIMCPNWRRHVGISDIVRNARAEVDRLLNAEADCEGEG